ncbi:MAG TPA: adenylate/guanylate cyclase domain-containing protein [Dongiaceae bacterium]|nr:adenylate/guanylate cyclase domain-containing protein [Dongiaceae bacterium]
MSAWSRNLSLWLSIVVIGALAGLGYDWLFEIREGRIAAMLYGIVICGLAIGYERGLILPALSRRLRSLPSLVYILLSEAILAGFVLAGTVIAGTFCWSVGLLSGRTWPEAVIISPNGLLYSLAIIVVFVFISRIRDLLGADVFRNLMLGRYHRPINQERVFLFIDIAGSTAYAERHGDLRAQQFIAAVFAALADPIRRHRGVIDDYIGDLAIISWPLRPGSNPARCLSCLIDIQQTVAAKAGDWQKRFGQVPQFRAALHGGSIVTAEIGIDRHKIAYFGDVMNTTARLEALSRSLDEPVLISDEILQRLTPLPAALKVRSLGSHAIRGRGQPLAISALDLAVADTAWTHEAGTAPSHRSAVAAN